MGVETWYIERLVTYLTASPESFSLDFISYGRKYGDSIIAQGKVSTGKGYHIAINSLVRFLGRDTLDISEITVGLLKSYEDFLRIEPVYKGHRNGGVVSTGKRKKGRAISLYISKIKTIHESAKKEYNDEERGIINIPYSPFNRYKIPSVELSEHRVLSIEQIQSIINLPYHAHKRRGLSEVNTAKDLFVLSFALMGINTADMYDEETQIVGDVLVYNRRKTRSRRKDKAFMKVRIEPEIMPLLQKYMKDGKLMFNNHYSSFVNMNKIINQGLKKIGKELGIDKLTYYHARHTMASICANKLGVDIARVDEMLNHSDPKLALARVYIEKDFKPLWEANRRLLDLFDWSFYKEKAEE
jgi:integrase